jgi:hypothetical protein
MNRTRCLWSLLLALLPVGGCSIAAQRQSPGSSAAPHLFSPSATVPSVGQLPGQDPRASVGIQIDTGATIVGIKKAWVLEAGRSLVATLQPQDEAFILSIQTQPFLLQSFTQDPTVLSQALERLVLCQA